MSTSIWQGNTGGNNLPTSSTNYLHVFGNMVHDSTATKRYYYVPAAGRISKFFVSVSGTPGAGATWIFKVYKNGSAVGLPTVTVDETNYVSPVQDLSNYADLAVGDYIYIEVTVTSTPGTATACWGFKFDSTTAKQSCYGGTTGGSNLRNDGTPDFINIYGHYGSFARTDENQVVSVAPCNGTISGLRVYLSAATGAAKSRVFSIRTGARGALADSAVALTFNDASTTTKATTTESVAVTAGQLISLGCASSGTPANSTLRYSFIFTADTDGDFMLPNCAGVTSSLPVATGTTYIPSTGFIGSYRSSITLEVINVAPVAFTAKAMYVDVSISPSSGKSWTYYFDDATDVSSLSVVIADTNTTGNDTSPTKAVTALDVICHKIVTVGAATASSLPTVSICGYITPANYSRGDVTPLPTDDADLTNIYTSTELTNVATDNDALYADQTFSGTDYGLHEFKNIVTGTSCDVTWHGKSDLAPSSSIVKLQAYHRTGDGAPAWVDMPGASSDNSTGAGTEFYLYGTLSSSIITEYKDGSNVIAFRVWQQGV